MEETPEDKAQTHCTAPELQSMQTNNTSWEYGGNAQASVDGACQIILACDVTDAANDKQQAVPVAYATLTTLAQAGIEPPRPRRARPQPSRRLWITAMTVRQPPRYWRTEGLSPPWPRGARSPMPLRLR